MKTMTNTSMFIVPNGLVSKANTPNSHFLTNEEWFNSDRCMKGTTKDLSTCWNIQLTPEDRLVQVWIHCDEQDNLSDHGFNDDQWEELFPKSGDKLEYSTEGLWRLPRLAPMYLPIRLFEGKKEGGILTLTSCDRVAWDIKLEQLPYRYGHRGPFEKCLKSLKCSDEEYARMKELEQRRMLMAGLGPSYSDVSGTIAKLAFEFDVHVDIKSYGTFIYDASRQTVLATIEDNRVVPCITTMLRDQHILERFAKAVTDIQ